MPTPTSQSLDRKKLKQLEAEFLMQYPRGFADPGLEKVSKSHRMDKMVELSQTCFSKKACRDVDETAENMVKVISRSSMISMFEKPKFKGFVARLDTNERAFLVKALDQMLNGKRQAGFEAMVDLLKTEKLAKWSLISIIPAYYAPTTEVFVKPTTAKGVLKHFEITEPVYKPTPTWDFYCQYRELINDAKNKVHKALSPTNAAFTGFLMMSVKT